MIKVGSDFSGVGAFNQALRRLNIEHKEVFACDMDKYARQTFIFNYGEPEYYPTNVYDREIPTESLDVYMTSPPCQAFSLAGKRKGEEDKRGVLFYNSHEFIQKNKPRFFIFENVKGLLSDDNGKTFQRWIDFLGGKTVNGNPVIFPHEDSVPYHVYYQVLNAKHYGIPQNRERIFIIGIRDDDDNDFSFPKPFTLKKRLRDVLESEVDEKYFLSDKMLESFTSHKLRHDDKGTGFAFSPKDKNDIANCIRANAALCPTDNMLKVVGDLNKGGERGAVYCESSKIMSCLSATDYKQPKQIQVISEIKVLFNLKGDNGHNVQNVYDTTGISPTVMENHGNVTKIQIHSNTAKGYDIAEEYEDSINFSIPNSKTRRGRVGKGVSQTLDTQCNQGIYTQQRIRRLTPLECFRLMDFNEEFKWDVSDSQAYRQAGNSICVGVLAAIISRLKL